MLDFTNFDLTLGYLNIDIEHGHLSSVLPVKMGIVHCYISLPDGNLVEWFTIQLPYNTWQSWLVDGIEKWFLTGLITLTNMKDKSHKITFKIIFNHHFPMVFLWFSYDCWTVKRLLSWASIQVPSLGWLQIVGFAGIVELNVTEPGKSWEIWENP